jgi:two-component system sensor histidine kinase/response regulator
LKGLNNLLISSSDLSKEYKEIAVSLNQQLEQTDNLINNLLHWIKNQHNVLEVNITKINLKELVIETKNLLQGNLVSKQLVFHNDVSNVAFVAADLELLRVVIRNILSNAVKFSPLEGEIFVSAYLQGQFFRMEIKDQGIGISEELLQKLFLKPMENALKKDYGTGLGLYLSFEFLQMMGGRIEVKSELGKGSTFILFLRVWEDLYQ